VPICPPHFPHGLACDQTKASAVMQEEDGSDQ